MVKKSLIALMIVAIMVVGGLVGRRFFTSKEAQIRGKFKETADLINKEIEGKPIAMLGFQRSIQALFDDPCSIETPTSAISGEYSPEELGSLAVRFRKKFADMSLAFYDIDMDFRGEHEAETSCTAVFNVRREGNKRVKEVRELETTLLRKEGQWVFSRIHVIEVLQK